MAFIDVVVVTERCKYSDGESSDHKLLVARTPEGWRVLNPVD